MKMNRGVQMKFVQQYICFHTTTLFFSLSLSPSLNIYIYIYVCVCVCVCVYFEECIFRQQVIIKTSFIKDDGTLFIIFDCNFSSLVIFFCAVIQAVKKLSHILNCHFKRHYP